MKVRRKRFAALVAANLPGPKSRPAPGRCNYPLRNGMVFCKRSSGFGTAHPGSGYCTQHDTAIYDPIHRYRKLQSSAIQKKMEHLDQQERDIFDLIPEIQLIRALMLDYVERFYAFQDELHKWYTDGGRKPKAALDITEVTSMIEAVTRIIERHHRIESKQAISLETFRRITESMGIIVARHVRDLGALSKIEAEWSSLPLDSKSTSGMAVPALPDVKQLADGDTDKPDNRKS